MPEDPHAAPDLDLDETLPRQVLRASAVRPRRALEAVLLHHPELRRVGERADLDGLRIGEAVGLSRLEPAFVREGGGAPRPIGDPYL
ncbi:MAG: hypothetical protein EP329_01560, partial [Deltaproteobacteria bacterium]